MAQGSIVKRTYKTKSGATRTVWRARVPDPSRPPGSGAKLEKAFARKTGDNGAEKWVADRLAEANRGEQHDPKAGNVTVAEMLDKLRVIWRTKRLEPATVAFYEDIYANHVGKRWGKVRVGSIDSADVQAWIDTMCEASSPALVIHAYGILRRILKLAVGRKAIQSNPCNPAGVTLPSRHSRPQREQLALELGELRMLYNAMPAHWRLPLLLSGLTGIRAGECWGLRRGDINLETAKMTVRVAAKELSTGVVYGQTKTHQTRPITLDPALVELLREHLSAPEAPRSHVRRGRPAGYPAVAVGDVAVHWVLDRDDPQRLLFTTKQGTPVAHRAFYNDIYRKAVVQLWPSGHRLHHLTWHCLRHSAATIAMVAAALAGETGDTRLVIVQKRLGHADIQMTAGLYSHINDEMDRKLAAHIGSAWAATEESNVVPLAAER